MQLKTSDALNYEEHYGYTVWCKTATAVGEGVLGVETDVIWGSDDETLGLSGHIFQAGRADTDIELCTSSNQLGFGDNCLTSILILTQISYLLARLRSHENVIDGHQLEDN